MTFRPVLLAMMLVFLQAQSKVAIAAMDHSSSSAMSTADGKVPSIDLASGTITKHKEEKDETPILSAESARRVLRKKWRTKTASEATDAEAEADTTTTDEEGEEGDKDEEKGEGEEADEKEEPEADKQEAESPAKAEQPGDESELKLLEAAEAETETTTASETTPAGNAKQPHESRIATSFKKSLPAKQQEAIQQFNALEFSMTACEKLDMAIRFITSLDFEEHFEKTFQAFYDSQDNDNGTSTSSETTSTPINADTADTQRRTAGVDTFQDAEAKFFAEVVLLQMIVLPISIAMLLFGGIFFYPACILCAAAIGLLGIFDVIDAFLPLKLECPMKLALSVVAAFLSAVLAVSCFRFGLFCFGSVSVGGVVYLLMDTFPQYLDPGILVFQEVTSSSDLVNSVSKDLSTAAWVIIVVFSIMGGMLLRYYEQATLELMTAALGGIGCTYSIHSLLLVRRHTLDPSVVFLLAFFLAVGGWKFQRYRRFKANSRYYYQRLNAPPEQLPMTNQDSASWMAAQQQQQLLIQQSMHRLLTSSSPNSGNKGDPEHMPSSEQISELTQSINKFLQVMEKGQVTKTEKEN